ncbi:hypothetical protein KIS4809_4350 [Bacillus sp. ZZV12-4809]|nr:hypothetical protein KIS4809_4350 [Bacillus sp. ZZV12-4809]
MEPPFLTFFDLLFYYNSIFSYVKFSAITISKKPSANGMALFLISPFSS